MQVRVEVADARRCERAVEGRTGDAHGEHPLLSRLVAQPERYIIQVNEGLIQVMRSSENGATKVSAATAASAMSGRNAW